MSVAQLLNVPRKNDPDSWELWSFANMDSHTQIIIAIQSQKGKTLTRYVLNPVSPANLQGFLVQHQQAHNDINGILGGGGSDYVDINPDDATAFAETLYLHAQDHIRIHQMLGI